MSTDPELDAHKEWIGYLQPVGLVVSPPALQKAQVIVSRNVVADQQRLLQHIVPLGDQEIIPNLRDLLQHVLHWQPTDLISPPDTLDVVLPAYQDTLRPSLAVPDPDHPGAWMALVQILPPGTDMDRPEPAREGWKASPQERLERLQRAQDIPVGLLFNGLSLRLVYAPKGETSGHLTFPIHAMTEVSGRPILAGLLCLLDADCIFSPDKPRRLTTLLAESRKYQATVSNALAGQVLEALHELLRGVQAADIAANGRILNTVVPDHYDHLYAGLVAVLMRLVFLLYAEDRELMPRDTVYQRHYAVGGLYERLRGDAGLYPDTLDQRYGAWAHLLALFRLVHDGGKHAGLSLPARHGDLFDPDRFPFLEGRPFGIARVLGAPFDAPRISDGVLYHVLRNLLMLKEERLSYRTLDVEQIGSVYEAIMGFGVERAAGVALAIKPKHIVVDLDDVLRKSAADRAKFFADVAECKLPSAIATAVGAARTPADLLAALGSRVSPYTPELLSPGTLYLQPGEERRRSGSHYTPRELTAPIVATTLRPIFEALGDRPTPEQILSLKVCDPAMGSGAFLVETCRQLADKLVESWEVHGCLPTLPADEEPYLHARRKVAQSCLYGVDKNPMAASLAKLSLWLVTLARDHSFTFLDHALKHGDSLVGFSRLQIASFRWDVEGIWNSALFSNLSANLGKAKAERLHLQSLDDDHTADVHRAYDASERALFEARLKGDLLVAAFFDGTKPKERSEKRDEYLRLWDDRATGSLAASQRVAALVADLRTGDRPVPAFHWEVEFPEVFDRENGGFDAMVGNPPFMGGSKLSSVSRPHYMTWLDTAFAGSRGKSDFVAYFFRQAFTKLKSGATLGLIATNTVRQGDTRETGLGWIRQNGGSIYDATRRLAWPGQAAVVVTVVHCVRAASVSARLDGQRVPLITAYLLPFGPDGNPFVLRTNGPLVYSGVNANGKGFIIDCRERDELLTADPRSTDLIRNFLGSEEMNTNIDGGSDRFAICVEGMTEMELSQYPPVYSHLSRTVRVQRQTSSEPRLREIWWHYSRPAREFYSASRHTDRVLVNGRVATYLTFTFQPPSTIFSDGLTMFLIRELSGFSCLQTRTHEVWVRFLGSSLKDDTRYIPEDCFETFPFPPNWQSSPTLETVGQSYYEFRAALMIRNNEGLTKTYNRFHDPEERSPDILKLRELHAAMDRAVLDAYGWTDIATTCAFLLDWEEPEEEEGKSKKKPWRYRWPDAVRDEVLARLLELNRVRAGEEQAEKEMGNTAIVKKKAEKKKGKTGGMGLFGGGE